METEWGNINQFKMLVNYLDETSNLEGVVLLHNTHIIGIANIM